MTHAQAVSLAREYAKAHAADHPYLSQAVTDPDWQPHAWVIDAIMRAGDGNDHVTLDANPALVAAAAEIAHVVKDARAVMAVRTLHQPIPNDMLDKLIAAVEKPV